MAESEEKKIIKCPKCKMIDAAKEVCPACGGSGQLVLSKVKIDRKKVYKNYNTDWRLN